MKKIIALALALIMVLSMGVVALASGEETTVVDFEYDYELMPGNKYLVTDYTGVTPEEKANLKVSYDFTSAYGYDEDGNRVELGYKGASLIESLEWVKVIDEDTKERTYDLTLTFKESLTSTTAKEIYGIIKIYDKEAKEYLAPVVVGPEKVGNTVVLVDGVKKAADADEADITDVMLQNVVLYAEDGAGYVSFTDGFDLAGVVKMAKGEKAQVYMAELTEDEVDALEAYLGEDYEAIVEDYKFVGTGFGEDVVFAYDAYSEDPHFFYAWDGEKLNKIDAEFDADEDVDAYVFTAPAKGIIIVTDVEIVAADETKNPDTGANDVVGVAAALAVVSLVAAGAVSLKK